MVALTKVLSIVDHLALERGEKQGKVYHLKVTTGELIEAFGLKPSLPHHRFVKGIVETNYHGTDAKVLGRGDGSQGFELHIKIWSK